MTRSVRSVACFCSLLAFASACTLTRLQMEVPAALAQVEPLKVQSTQPRRWDVPLAFGTWTSTPVRQTFREQRSFGTSDVTIAGGTVEMRSQWRLGRLDATQIAAMAIALLHFDPSGVDAG